MKYSHLFEKLVFAVNQIEQNLDEGFRRRSTLTYLPKRDECVHM